MDLLVCARYKHESLTPCALKTPLTIADAQAIVASWIDLAPGRAQKMRTALSTAARALAPQQDRKAAAAAVRMDCVTLSTLLKRPAATFGLSAGRMMSLCSELRSILRRLGLHEPDVRGLDIVSPALQACIKTLPEYRKWALIDFLRFLELEGIAPDAADDALLMRYETRCIERTLCADPPGRVRQIASNWNWACQHVAGWPGQALCPPDRTGYYSLPFESYPLAFQQDLERYTRRLAGRDFDDIFSEALLGASDRRVRRVSRPLKPASIEGRCWIIRSAAAALVQTDTVTPADMQSLRDLVDPLDRAETIIRFFLQRAGGKTSPMTHRVAQMLYLVARDHCDGLPDAHVERLRVWAKRVATPEPSGLTEKNTKRLRGLMQLRARAMLLCFPRELVRRAGLPGMQAHEAARLMMYATALEILLVCPMRRGNLAGLRLDQHLHQPDPRRPLYSHILINAGEVKNELAISWPLPAETQKLLETFVTRHRSHLMTPGNPYLFGIEDRQRKAQGMGAWLSRAVTEAIGVEFNVHLARHFAAWNFLRMNPGQYEVVRQVLGHRSVQTTIAHYVGLEADSAAAHFDKAVLGDRQALRPIARHAFRQGTGGLTIGNRRVGR